MEPTPSTSSSKTYVTLEVDGVKFVCDKELLTSRSSYFQAMFSNAFIEQSQEVVKIHGVDAAAMQFILKWMEDTSQIDLLDGDEVLVVLQAAAMLQLERLQRSCEDVMVSRWLAPSNCLRIAVSADQLSLQELHRKASALALWNFTQVRHCEEFLGLSIEALVQYIAQDSLTTTDGELEVFDAVSSWVEHELEQRHPDTINALMCVRLSYITISDIQSMFNYASVKSCLTAQELLSCVISIKEGKEPAIRNDKNSDENDSQENRGCCDPLKRIADHLTSCKMMGGSSKTTLDVPMDTEKNSLNNSTSGGFSNEILMLAKQILSLPARQLPIVACIIGHVKPSKTVEDDNMPAYSVSKKSKAERSKSGTPHIFYYDSERTEKPTPFLHLSKIDQGPVEAVGYTVISKGQDLYVLGGEYHIGYGDWNNSVWKYNVWNQTWSYETSLSAPRRHHAVICLHEDLFLIGGCGRYRVMMDTVERYNLIDKGWHKCAPLPCTLFSAATCAHNELIYVITSQIICYNPNANTWYTLPDVIVPPGTSFSAAVSCGNFIYLTGSYTPTLMRFDPDNEKTIHSVGQFRSTTGNVCVVGEKIISFTDENGQPCVESYDTKTSTFHLLWKGDSKDEKISFKKLGGAFPLIMF